MPPSRNSRLSLLIELEWTAGWGAGWGGTAGGAAAGGAVSALGRGPLSPSRLGSTLSLFTLLSTFPDRGPVSLRRLSTGQLVGRPRAGDMAVGHRPQPDAVGAPLGVDPKQPQIAGGKGTAERARGATIDLVGPVDDGAVEAEVEGGGGVLRHDVDLPAPGQGVGRAGGRAGVPLQQGDAPQPLLELVDLGVELVLGGVGGAARHGQLVLQ